jgi:hypothetical protein
MDPVDKIALVSPPANWQPNAGAALTRLHARMDEPRRTWRPLLPWAIAAVSCIAIASPQLWKLLRLERVEVIRVDFDNLPDEAKSLRAQPLNRPDPPKPARDINEIRDRVGYVPQLPRAGILSGSPKLSTIGPMAFGTVVKLADLELALQKAGVTDQPIRKEWDGANLTVRFEPLVIAEWNDITLMQSRPPALSMPPGFDLPAFGAAVLRSIGLSRKDAGHFAARMATAPAMLLGIGSEDAVNIRDVALRSGPATLVEDLSDNGKIERVTLIWSAADRVFVLSGKMSADLAVAVGNDY